LTLAVALLAESYETAVIKGAVRKVLSKVYVPVSELEYDISPTSISTSFLEQYS
jgi:hypothetical protein